VSTTPERDNPFAPPKAAVLEAASPEAGRLVAEGQKVAASRAAGWIGDGWRIFTRSPGMWIVTTIVFMVTWILLSILPIISLVSGILGPVFLGGLMLGCDKVHKGGNLELGDLFAGFQRNAGGLMLVGLLYLVGWFLIMVFVGFGAFVLVGTTVGFTAESLKDNAAILGPAFLLVGLIAIGLSMPLVMAIWFAPALVVFHDMQAFAAMRASFSGCLRNLWPFLLYGILALAIAIIAVLPVGLGLLVWIPMLWGSLYAGYRDIFLLAD